MCQSCIEWTSTAGTGFNLILAKCLCLCRNLPALTEAVGSEEVCADCGHAHATAEAGLRHSDGVKPGRFRLRPGSER